MTKKLYPNSRLQVLNKLKHSIIILELKISFSLMGERS